MEAKHHEEYKKSHKCRPRQMFSEKEDSILRKYILGHSVTDWNIIAKRLPGKTPRQCRERWQHYVNPELIHTEWTEEEDSFLKDLYDKHGKKWTVIAAAMTGRSANCVRNRWMKLERHMRRGSHPATAETSKTIEPLKGHDKKLNSLVEMFSCSTEELEYLFNYA